MAQAVMRVEERTHQILRELSVQLQESMQTIVSRAVEEYRRAHMFQDADTAFAALRRDPKAWKEELEERESWAATLSDHLVQTGDMPVQRTRRRAARRK